MLSLPEPTISPRNFSGTVTSTFIIGSRITGLARLAASWNAIEAAIQHERDRGWEVESVESENRGFDLISRRAHPEDPKTFVEVRFIEVKGRVVGAGTVTVTSGEIRTALNKPDDFVLAIVQIDGEGTTPRYLRQPFQREPDFGVTSVNYNLNELLARAGDPS